MSYDAKRDIERADEEELQSRSTDNRQHRDGRRNKAQVYLHDGRLKKLELAHADLAKKLGRVKPQQVHGDDSIKKMIGDVLQKVTKMSSEVSRLRSSLGDLEKKVAANTASSDVKKLKASLGVLDQKVKLNASSITSAAYKGRKNFSRAVSSTNLLSTKVTMSEFGLSGNIWLDPGLSTDGYICHCDYNVEIDGYDLNSALAGTYKKTVAVSLVATTDDGYTTGGTHTWANLGPIIIASEVVSDEDVLVPAIVSTLTQSTSINVSNGTLSMDIIFDTDNDVTKHYAVGDYLTVTLKVSSDNLINGFYIEPLVITYTII